MKRSTIALIAVAVAGIGAWTTTTEPGGDLADLTVAADTTTGYKRDLFPHWIDQGASCDTREIVLQRQGQDVTRDNQCRATGGRWVSPYDGITITQPGKVDVDHMVPLAEAWRSGAGQWTTQQRQTFANDLDGQQLIAVTAASNRGKGDQDPAHWKPTRSYWCTYATNWVSVKTKYHLTVDVAERDALSDMLAICP